MPLSSKILRGLKVKGHTIYSPPRRKKLSKPFGRFSLQQQSSVNPGKKIKQEENILEKFQQEGENCAGSFWSRLLKRPSFKGTGLGRSFCKGRKEGSRGQKTCRRGPGHLGAGPERTAGNAGGAEPEIIKIAVSIAEKLLDYKIETDEGCILSLMARALNTIPAGENVLLKLNPGMKKYAERNSTRCGSCCSKILS